MDLDKPQSKQLTNYKLTEKIGTHKASCNEVIHFFLESSVLKKSVYPKVDSTLCTKLKEWFHRADVSRPTVLRFNSSIL